MKKITDEQIIQIRELRNAGHKIREISEMLNIAFSTVCYNVSDESKKRLREQQRIYFMNLSKERKSILYRRRKDYINKYITNKYKTDEIFRQKKMEYAREYYRRRKENGTIK